MVLEQFIGLLLLGVVSHDLGQAVKHAVLIPESQHYPIGPEPGPVLPLVPAIVGGPAGLRGEPELPLRLTPEHILRDEENRAVLTYDLVRGVPEDALRSG